MIPSARFGDIRIIDTEDNKVICSLYSLYEDGIREVASNKEFCLFLLTELHSKLSLHDSQVMSRSGDTSREEAKRLYHRPDETTHLFFRECKVLLRGTTRTLDSEKVEILPDEDSFKRISEKVILDFNVSDFEEIDGTFRENAILEFSVANSQLIAHIAEDLLVEC